MKKIVSGKNIILDKEELERVKLDVEKKYGDFLSSLGYDWENDPNMKGTPARVAKMYLEEVTRGTYTDRPRITTFENQLNHTPF